MARPRTTTTQPPMNPQSPTHLPKDQPRSVAADVAYGLEARRLLARTQAWKRDRTNLVRPI